MPPNNDTPANLASSTNEDARGELTAQIDDLLNTLSNKFAGVSSEIFAKMDEMSRRLDNLEAKLKDAEDKKSGSS
ncbi:heat shock factor-binding protein 1 [Staphylotrichum tortipilum]|uniref:Heat shock factor-binding protein 1 n=1 Tax=Staphylotrichum tortipilum TaxID=2831512 RepID=A0AAN6MQM9_9PEZI|nr:heat shock factor-binding protein 1 [Staphylotrichum longicolle]